MGRKEWKELWEDAGGHIILLALEMAAIAAFIVFYAEPK